MVCCVCNIVQLLLVVGISVHLSVCVLVHILSALLQVVNAFSLQTDAEIKAKLITRLSNMIDLHQLLNISLTSNDLCFHHMWISQCSLSAPCVTCELWNLALIHFLPDGIKIT